MAKISIDRQLRQARTLELKGARAEAATAYRAILADYPGNQRAQAALAALEGPVTPPAVPAGATAPSEDQLARLSQLVAAGDHARLAEAVRAMLQHYPAHGGLWEVLGTTLRTMGEAAEAEPALARAAELIPGKADLLLNLGAIRLDLERPAEALPVLEQAAALAPQSSEINFFHGLALKELERFPQALEAFAKAEALDPADYRAPFEHGRVLGLLERHDDARQSYSRALLLAPEHPHIHERLASMLFRCKRFEESVHHYAESLRLGGHSDFVLAHKLLVKLNLADWSAFDEFDACKETLGLGEDAVSPLATFALEDHPARQLQRAQVYTARFNPPRPEPFAPRSARPRRIRIGYFTASLAEHPVAYLTTGLFRHHDKSRFEVAVFSYSASREGRMREEIASHAEHFVNIDHMNDDEVMAMVRANELDIAIDMQGYTDKPRTSLFARRLAPIQVSYLAFPGSMGAPFIDYLLADPVVIPPEQRAHYSEKLLLHPDSFMPADNLRAISSKHTSRSDFGLPEQGVVFMSHNAMHKVGPREFAIWMRVLQQVEGSVLWLRAVEEQTRQVIADQARARGVDPARLIYAPKLEHPEHLARHRHADLFLDSFNYGAHTTACEALWAGLPVVTKAGEQFSARVGASLLTAVGMPELIAHSEADYEQLILALASDPNRLAATRAKLAANRLTEPLFDPERYTRNFEALMALAVKKHRELEGAGAA